jgi:hypothetical protein
MSTFDVWRLSSGFEQAPANVGEWGIPKDSSAGVMSSCARARETGLFWLDRFLWWGLHCVKESWLGLSLT